VLDAVVADWEWFALAVAGFTASGFVLVFDPFGLPTLFLLGVAVSGVARTEAAEAGATGVRVVWFTGVNELTLAAGCAASCDCKGCAASP
jgi:hypothetical protein